MKNHTTDDVLIRIDSLDQLFNGSTINPLSDKPAVILGEAGLLHAIQQELSMGLREWHNKRLIIQLPSDQLTSDMQTKTINAVRQYARVKITENNALIRISRWRSLIGLILAIVIAGILLAILLIVTSTLLAAASDTVKGIFAGLITIFIWSTVWNPWDRLVYEWIEPWRENRILRSIMKMEIIVQEEPVSQS